MYKVVFVDICLYTHILKHWNVSFCDMYSKAMGRIQLKISEPNEPFISKNISNWKNLVVSAILSSQFVAASVYSDPIVKQQK